MGHHNWFVVVVEHRSSAEVAGNRQIVVGLVQGCCNFASVVAVAVGFGCCGGAAVGAHFRCHCVVIVAESEVR